MNMMTVKQVSSLTGISVRTLQFYDEIGLFKPTEVSEAGYRFYDDSALEELQQILFFKELDFTLKEIKAIMKNPAFNQREAFQQQRALIACKRDRLNALLEMLDKLIKGEPCMEFQNFDMSSYFQMLSDLKESYQDKIIAHYGSLAAYDQMISDLKGQEDEIASLAIKQYGSLENYTNAMEKNLKTFLSDDSAISQQTVNPLIDQTEEITRRLTANLKKDAASPEIQKIMGELVTFVTECNKGIEMGAQYWPSMVEQYTTNPVWIQGNDQKYGEGASQFIGRALDAYLNNC